MNPFECRSASWPNISLPKWPVYLLKWDSGRVLLCNAIIIPLYHKLSRSRLSPQPGQSDLRAYSLNVSDGLKPTSDFNGCELFEYRKIRIGMKTFVWLQISENLEGRNFIALSNNSNLDEISVADMRCSSGSRYIRASEKLIGEMNFYLI